MPFDSTILRQAVAVFAQVATAKLARTDLGRTALKADQLIFDRVKYDPDDQDRVWLGTRRTAMKPNAQRNTRAVISEDVYVKLSNAVLTDNVEVLAEFGRRIANAFSNGDNWCPFIEEKRDV